jgi:trans-aconitate 2-methyltransferase
MFERERTRPVADLLNAVPIAGIQTAADIGCGPGNSTEALAARAPGASILGLDSSVDMIEAARRRLPRVRFVVADIVGWSDPGPYDLILANAALQWVPHHETLFPALVDKLARGGCLAVQMPDNLDEPAHRLMRETAACGPWAAKLGDVSRPPLRPPQGYYAMLAPSCSQVDVWRTVYYHPLAGGPGAVVEWLKGTGLRPFLAPLSAHERSAFLERYGDAVARAYPALPDGTVLLPYPRLFIVATR